jgi:hypothetical protein
MATKTKTRFAVALEGAQLDVQAADALHVIRHQLEGLRLALGELAHGPDEPAPESFDALEFMLADITDAVEALIEAPRKEPA